MIRQTLLYLSLMIAVIVLSGACSKDRSNGDDKQDVTTLNDVNVVNIGIINFIKTRKLVNFQSTTIGKAFDNYRYISKKDWKAVPLDSKRFTVDFIGWFDPDTLTDTDMQNGIRNRGINVTFVLNPDYSFYLFTVSKLESKTDGKLYRSQLNDFASILAKIYANEKIIF